MTATPASGQPAPTCCGGDGQAWAPAAGQPQVLACQLCPHPSNPNYWRRTAKGAPKS